MKTTEFIGPPGSGKSTLCLSLQKALDKSNTPNVLIIGPDVYPGQASLYFGLMPSLTALKKLTAFSGALLETMSVLPLLIQPYIRGTRLKKPGYVRIFRLALTQGYKKNCFLKFMPDQSVGMFDPGALMRLVNGYLYAYAEPAGQTVEIYLKRITLPDVLVVCRVATKTGLARLHSRPRGLPKRMRQLGQEKWPEVITQGNKAASVIAEEADKLGVTVMDYNSEKLTCEEMADKLIRTLA